LLQAIFQALRPISIQLPSCVVYLMSLKNAFGRIQAFLAECGRASLWRLASATVSPPLV
jgi:hypothetical protein